MNSLFSTDKSLDAHARDLWQWWLSEISSMVPPKLLRFLGGPGEQVILEWDHSRLRIFHATPLGETEILGTENRQDLLEKHPEWTETRVALRLAEEQGLKRHFKLPLAAEENLNQVVAFEMDRLTPFKNDQIYSATTVLSRSRANRQIEVELVLTPKEKLDRLIEDLAQRGWRPETVFLKGTYKVANSDLLPERLKPKKNELPQILNLTLASTISAFLILLLILPLWSARVESNRLRGEIKKTSKMAQEVESMREESDKLLHQALFLQEKKRSEPLLLDTLEELSRVIPDDTWLNGLQFANDRVIIQGQSPSSSSLIKQIEASPHFRNVNFVSPVTKDAGNNLERFQIAADVVNGRFSEEAH